MEASGLIELGHLNVPKDLEVRIIIRDSDEVRIHLQTSIHGARANEMKAAKSIFTRDQLIFFKDMTLQKIVDLLNVELEKSDLQT